MTIVVDVCRAISLLAQTVADLMERMRMEMFGNSASAREVVPQIDAVVILDRSVDLLTPLSTQLTYEGLIDEVFGIKHCKSFFINSVYII